MIFNKRKKIIELLKTENDFLRKEISCSIASSLGEYNIKTSDIGYMFDKNKGKIVRVMVHSFKKDNHDRITDIYIVDEFCFSSYFDNRDIVSDVDKIKFYSNFSIFPKKVELKDIHFSLSSLFESLIDFNTCNLFSNVHSAIIDEIYDWKGVKPSDITCDAFRNFAEETQAYRNKLEQIVNIVNKK